MGESGLPYNLSRLFPFSSVVLNAKVSATAVHDLAISELRAIEDWTRHRRAEFATGRALARAAMAQLGVETGAVPPGEEGEPLWPEGVVGSISHKNGFCVAAVARPADARSIGIDLEVVDEIPGAAIADIASESELAGLRSLSPGVPDGSLANVLFTAKEAVFKAQFPVTRDASIDFLDLALSFSTDESRFSFQSQWLTGTSTGPIAGHVLRSDGWIVSGAALMRL